MIILLLMALPGSIRCQVTPRSVRREKSGVSNENEVVKFVYDEVCIFRQFLMFPSIPALKMMILSTLATAISRAAISSLNIKSPPTIQRLNSN